MNRPAVKRRPVLVTRHRRAMARHPIRPRLPVAAPPSPKPRRAPQVQDRPATPSATLVGGDVAAVLLSSVLMTSQLLNHLAAGAVMVILLARLDLYRFRWTISVLDDLPALALACLAGFAAGVVVFSDLRTRPATEVLLDSLAVAASVVVIRGALYCRERRGRRRRLGRATMILGTGQLSCRLGRAILDHPECGLRLVGYLDDQRRRQELLPAPMLGHPRELARRIVELGVSNVIVTFGSTSVASLVDVVRTCDRLRCEIFVVPRLFELHSRTWNTEYVHGLPVVRLRRAPFRGISWSVKRAADLVGSAAAIAVLSPLFVVCALAVRLEGGPGVLFRQVRVGIDGRPFQIYKFRTMTPVGQVESQQRWTIAGDPRIGPVGRVLRATSLDELPQLWNVFRGDMSLVGPRPERPYFVEQLSQEHPRYRARHRVPVGLTGWAAIHGLRGDTSISDRVEFDNAYIQNWSLWLDVKIMLRTLGVLWGRTGA